MLTWTVMAVMVHSAASRELAFEGFEGFKLRGTLELPVGPASRLPAVLLLPGSGPPDRNGNVPPVLITDLLKQIAERLAKDGIASFRFDKRSAAVYKDTWPKAVSEFGDFFRWDSFVGDAKAALACLRAQPEVDPARVGMLGHSEGGLITLQFGNDFAGKKDSPKAFVFAGTAGRNLGVLIKEQIAASLKQAGVDEATSKKYSDYIDSAIEESKKGNAFPPNPPSGLEALFNPSVTRLMKTYVTLEPLELAKAIKAPSLVINGEMDIQVSAERDAPILAKALGVKAIIVPGTSHNLKSVASRTDPGFAGPVVKQVLDQLAKFFKEKL